MTGKRSISALIESLYWVFKVGFWLHLLFLIAQVASAVHYDKTKGMVLDLKGNFYIAGNKGGWDTSLEMQDKSGMTPTVLVHKRAYALFKLNGISAFSLLLLFMQEATWIIWIFVTYQLMRIFQSLRRNNYFEKSNIRRLRIIAMVIALAPIIAHAEYLMFTSFAAENIQISGHNIPVVQDIFFLPAFINIEMITGVLTMFLLLVLTEIFRSGLELKQESDLTI